MSSKGAAEGVGQRLEAVSSFFFLYYYLLIILLTSVRRNPLKPCFFWCPSGRASRVEAGDGWVRKKKKKNTWHEGVERAIRVLP